MRKKRLVNVLTSAALTAALVMSMGMTAMADYEGNGTDAVTKIDLTKVISYQSDESVYAPNATFKFDVTPGSGGTKVDNQTTIAGPDGGLSAVNADITFGVADGLLDIDSKSNSKTSESGLTIDASKFKEPGIYEYIVHELSGTETNGSTYVNGMTYSSKYYLIYLYVVYKDATSPSAGYEVLYAVAQECDSAGKIVDGATKMSSLTFTNSYGDETVEDSLHDLTIKKTVTGNQPVVGDTFNFTVEVNGADGEYYAVTGIGNVTYLMSGSPQEFTLQDNGSIKIEGLSATDKVTVKEGTAESGSTYTMSVSGTGLTGDPTTIDNTAVTVSADGAIIEYTNERNASTPTGIILNFAPYILLVAFAGVFAVLFLGKKREEF